MVAAEPFERDAVILQVRVGKFLHVPGIGKGSDKTDSALSVRSELLLALNWIGAAPDLDQAVHVLHDVQRHCAGFLIEQRREIGDVR
ncbi:hypothetical protein OR214_02047 [Ralstonia pickettii OR214]|uniref:Uncharacterized protein n=1 Tax=Ralstonia pickettii OR214 TaxID=1264675 RepID=R0CM82_RALPI|nr:hypothetical protein OR214_02047 [Ralstonia pickettii OR214]